MLKSFLPLERLTAEAFAPFGDIIQTTGNTFHHINACMVERYHDLAPVDVLDGDGRPGISLLVAKPYELPLAVQQLERHPRSSQAFIPLSEQPFLVIVAPPGDTVGIDSLRAFVTDGRQGVNYRRGVWHHVLLAIGEMANFVAIDRIGNGPNCDLFDFAPEIQCWIDIEPSQIK